jgi:hypothetical protein
MAFYESLSAIGCASRRNIASCESNLVLREDENPKSHTTLIDGHAA